MLLYVVMLPDMYLHFLIIQNAILHISHFVSINIMHSLIFHNYHDDYGNTFALHLSFQFHFIFHISIGIKHQFVESIFTIIAKFNC